MGEERRKHAYSWIIHYQTYDTLLRYVETFRIPIFLAYFDPVNGNNGNKESVTLIVTEETVYNTLSIANVYNSIRGRTNRKVSPRREQFAFTRDI